MHAPCNRFLVLPCRCIGGAGCLRCVHLARACSSPPRSPLLPCSAGSTSMPGCRLGPPVCERVTDAQARARRTHGPAVRDADRPLVGRSDSDTTHDRCRSDSPFFRRKVATAELALDTHGTVTARRKWNRPGLHAPYVPTEYRLTFVSTPSARTKDRWTYR